MIVEIHNHTRHPVPRAFMDYWLKRLAQRLRRKHKTSLLDQQLVVAFVGTAHMRKLNREYRGHDYATDVLSFAAIDASYLGELVLCPSVLIKQARAHKLSYRYELGYLLIHGVLHLLGYDHEKSPAQAKVMFTLQDDLFDRLCQSWETDTK